VKVALIICGALALLACTTPVEHETFTRVMDRQVGKNVEDSDFYPTYYKLKPADSKRLANGNSEDAYFAGRKAKCKVFFERDASGRVLRWRSEGDRDDCVIFPVTTEQPR
jgi:hypothetical protein